MSGFFYSTLMAGHEERGEWCSCGETIRDCFYHAIVIPYRALAQERMWQKLLKGGDEDSC